MTMLELTPSKNPWDIPGLIEELRDLNAKRVPYIDIAHILNSRHPGASLTPRACIGKAFRLGLTGSRKKPEIKWKEFPGLLDEFKALHASGESYSVIVETLNEKYEGLGLTKKAATSKARRLGLAKRENHTDGPRSRKASGAGWRFPSINDRAAPLTQAERMEYKRRLNNGEAPVRLTRSPIPKEDNYTQPEMRKSLFDLTDNQGRDLHLCRFPYGDGPFTFCGRPADGSYPQYCAFHSNVHQFGSRGTIRLICEAAE